jgi:hypothetical protein
MFREIKLGIKSESGNTVPLEKAFTTLKIGIHCQIRWGFLLIIRTGMGFVKPFWYGAATGTPALYGWTHQRLPT